MGDLASVIMLFPRGLATAVEPPVRVILRPVPGRTSPSAHPPEARERRTAPRHPVGHLGIVVQITARRRLRRIWRRGVTADVAITDVSTLPGGKVRLTGRDLRTGFIVVMQARRASDRVEVIGLRAPHQRRMRHVAWRFRAIEAGPLPAMVRPLSLFSAPLPGQGPWDLPRRTSLAERTPSQAEFVPIGPRLVGGTDALEVSFATGSTAGGLAGAHGVSGLTADG